MEDKNESFVKWRTFSITITVAVIVIGGLYAKTESIDGELEAYKNQMFGQITDIKTDVSTIKSDVGWLKDLFQNSQIEIE